jgi:hypothetical protein
MFDFHGFFLGFWTTLSVILSAFYVVMYCYESFNKAFNQTIDKINNYIDEQYSATAQKLPNDENFVVNI